MVLMFLCNESIQCGWRDSELVGECYRLSAKWHLSSGWSGRSMLRTCLGNNALPAASCGMARADPEKPFLNSDITLRIPERYSHAMTCRCGVNVICAPLPRLRSLLAV
jgi:hypothetical protein